MKMGQNSKLDIPPSDRLRDETYLRWYDGLWFGLFGCLLLGFDIFGGLCFGVRAFFVFSVAIINHRINFDFHRLLDITIFGNLQWLSLDFLHCGSLRFGHCLLK